MEGRISSHEAKTRFGELLNRVQNGEELIITRHDLPVARIVPASRTSRSELEQLFTEMIQERKTNPLNPTGKRKIGVRELIEEGRK